jgi:hypothetical protein
MSAIECAVNGSVGGARVNVMARHARVDSGGQCP